MENSEKAPPPDGGGENAGGEAPPASFKKAHTETSEQFETTASKAVVASGPWDHSSPAPDSTAIRQQVEMQHRLAKMAITANPAMDGVFKFAAIREGKTPIIHEFKPGDVDGMVGCIARYSSWDGYNVYTTWALFRPNASSTGALADLTAVLALVIDSDADTGKSATPPLDPPFSIETSAGNFQFVYPLSRALGEEEASAIADTLTTVSGGDSRGKDPSSLWRSAGTPNRPTKKKLGRNRSPIPHVVRISHEWNGELVSPEDLSAAIKMAKPAVPARVKPKTLRETVVAGSSTKTDAELLKRLPKTLRDKMAAPAAPEEDRSKTAFDVCMQLFKHGLVADEAMRLIAAHPAGVGERYTTGGKDLSADVHRIWEKHEEARPDLAKGGERGKVNNLAALMDKLRADKDLCDIVVRDQMANTTMIVRPVPGSSSEDFRPHRLTDTDASQLQELVQRDGLPRVSRELVHQALDLLASENAFHPVQQYLNDLQWDGKERLTHVLSRYLGAEETNYVLLIGRLFMIAMVARIFDPGVKVDYMLVLEGPQGVGKSTACKILAGGYYSDNLPDITAGKDVSIHLSGKWIVEIAEMHAMTNAANAQLKAFITRQEEEYRPPYGIREIVQKRQCVFIGTTNKSNYLRDETGGRRFWPVKTGPIDLEALSNDRDQLLAEAVVAYRAGEQWWPSREMEAHLIAHEQSARMERDIWADPIADYLEGEEFTTAIDVAIHGLLIPKGQCNKPAQARIQAVLTSLGWHRDGGLTTGTRRQRWLPPTI